MARNTGILIDNDTLDLKVSVERSSDGRIAQGLVVGNTLYQNQALILHAHKGEYKDNPTLGAGISDILADGDLVGWKREIVLQLESDLMNVNKVELTTSKLTIDADYGTE
ncbi:MAG: hypothetical protein IJ686_04860 [Bacteroidales bacterium]|nr:hypothetical protein [Bacteroidales bacterium]